MSKQEYPPPLVIVDSREQKPYSFPQEWPLPIKKALPSGDYSIVGHELTFAIERKELTDLFGCIWTDRFRRELERLKSYAKAFLVIEGNLWKIKNNRFYKGKINAVIGMLQAIPLKYGVQVLFLDDRETAESFVAGLLEKYNRYLLTQEDETING